MNSRPITIIEPQIRALVASNLVSLVRPIGTHAGLQPGTVLWVREPFWLPDCYNHLSPSQAAGRGAVPNFIADYDVGRAPREHCKRRFARELLRIWHRQHLVVRVVETFRLQTLSDDEIRAQGFGSQDAFARAWNHNLSLSRGNQTWAANPEALKVAFDRVDQPVRETTNA